MYFVLSHLWPGSQADYHTIADFFASRGNYQTNPYYFYLPSFWLFSPFYQSYTILKIAHFVMLAVILVLLEYVDLHPVEYYTIYGFVIWTFYLDIERGNSNFFILLCLLGIILLLQRQLRTQADFARHYTVSLPIAFLCALASFKLNFGVVILLFLLYFRIALHWSWASLLVFGLQLAGMFVLVNILWVIHPAQIPEFLANTSPGDPKTPETPKIRTLKSPQRLHARNCF